MKGADRHNTISGTIVDIAARTQYGVKITIGDGKISRIEKSTHTGAPYILPGFIDAHVHVESSLLTPGAFARLSVPHGTVAVVADPHEIANVMGAEGVRYMIADGKRTPLKFFFGVPSCVPATPLESSGAVLDAAAVAELLKEKELWFLAEMMNFPGVVNGFPDVMDKLAAAKKLGKVVDGHAPGLSGEALKKYAAAGVTTDHECCTFEEAEEKIALGMKILIREGSAARNLAALLPLIDKHSGMVMLCSDDKHPDDLVLGQINLLVKRALAAGCDLYNVLNAACVNPVRHYGLPVGLLRAGDPADFITVDDLSKLNVTAVYINGRKEAADKKPCFEVPAGAPLNNFIARTVTLEDIEVRVQPGKLRVIDILPDQLVTKELLVDPKVSDGKAVCDVARDLLKIVVVNRYKSAPLAIGFVHGLGLKRGALASSVAHDSHNIVAAGTSDAEIIAAINTVFRNQGGLVAVDGNDIKELALPVGGIMSNEPGEIVAEKYGTLDKQAKKLGSPLNAPFMTLSFLALLVIPELKLGDRGLFDGRTFQFVPLFAS